MTADEFLKVTGTAPELDDLERANCPEAGQIGHWACGLCTHGRPRFRCQPCLQRQINAWNSHMVESVTVRNV